MIGKKTEKNQVFASYTEDLLLTRWINEYWNNWNENESSKKNRQVNIIIKPRKRAELSNDVLNKNIKSIHLTSISLSNFNLFSCFFSQTNKPFLKIFDTDTNVSLISFIDFSMNTKIEKFIKFMRTANNQKIKILGKTKKFTIWKIQKTIFGLLS